MLDEVKVLENKKNISILLVKVILSYARNNNIPFGQLAKAYDKSWEGDPEAKIDIVTYDKIFTELATASNDRYFGLKFGKQISFSQLSVTGYLIMSAETILSAVLLFLRFQSRLGHGIFLDVQVLEHEVVFNCHVPRYFLNGQQRIEAFTSSLVVLFQEAVAKKIWPVEVCFSHEIDEQDSMLIPFFNLVPSRGKANRFVFKKSDLLLQILSSDRKLNEHLVSRLSLNSVSSLSGVSERVILCLQKQLAKKEIMSLRSVSQQLGFSPRNLQVLLSKENTTFRKLQENLMVEVSRKLLSENCTIGELSFLLGFSDVASFQRAYKRWTGQTPGSSRSVVQRVNTSSRSWR